MNAAARPDGAAAPERLDSDAQAGAETGAHPDKAPGTVREKAPGAFRTISEVAEELDIPAHVLRFWETKFPHLSPMKRGGGRRYYRPADMSLLRGIRALLHDEGLTIKGLQKVFRERGPRYVAQVGDGEAAAVGEPVDGVAEWPAAGPAIGPAMGPAMGPAAGPAMGPDAAPRQPAPGGAPLRLGAIIARLERARASLAR